MRNTTLNRKGVAILLVSLLILVALPATLIMLNLSTSQKSQATHFNAKLNTEMNSLSGVNYGYNTIMGFSTPAEADKPGLRTSNLSLSDDDKSSNFDLTLNKTGEGFFKQRIYMVLSKSNQDKNSTIVMADAELFDLESEDRMVITHDYWSTVEPYEIGVMADVLSLKNFRGKDQLRALAVSNLELSSDYQNAISKLKESSNLPQELKICWDTVEESITSDKIKEDSETPTIVNTNPPHQYYNQNGEVETPSQKPGQVKGTITKNKNPDEKDTDANSDDAKGDDGDTSVLMMVEDLN